MKKTLFKNIPFKLKLFLSIGSIFLMLILVICLLFSEISIQTAIVNDQASSDMILERITTQIDSLYEQMNIAATSITKNPTLKSIVLKLNTSDEEPVSKYLEKVQQERTIQTALGNIMFSPIISNVLLYNQKENYFYYSGSYFSDIPYVYQQLSRDSMAEAFQSRPAIYLPPGQSRWTASDRAVLSVLRNFTDASTTEDTIVEVQVPLQLLKDICTQESFQEEKEILILDSDGTIVYPYNESPKVLPPETITNLCGSLKQGTRSHYSYDYSYRSLRSASTGFTVLLISNNQTVHHQIAIYLLTMVAVALLALAATLGITFMLITKITQPLNQLIHHVNSLTLDNDTQLSLPKDTFNEFEILNTSLQQMVSKLKTSMHKIYELRIRENNANLAALQAQIDPHFLYNALNNISASSEIYGSDVTAQMCQKLSSMMQYVTSKKREVPLIEELTHTRNYLEFMKVSYEDYFDYELAVPQELHNMLIPKLSIQPFAENSFRHGFRDTVPPWHLSILCHVSDGCWQIEITDNGSGFSQEALDQLSLEPLEAADLEINGLGLNNTFSRMTLFFGNGFSYHIDNLSKGSRITLRGDWNHDKTTDR